MQTVNLPRHLPFWYGSTCVTSSVLIENFLTFCNDPLVKFVDTLSLVGISTKNYRMKSARIVFGNPELCWFRIFVCINVCTDDEPLQTALFSYRLTLIVCSHLNFDKIKLTIHNHQSASTPLHFIDWVCFFVHHNFRTSTWKERPRQLCVSKVPWVIY